MVKYAEMDGRGSRYGCGGVIGEAVAGIVLAPGPAEKVGVVTMEKDDGGGDSGVVLREGGWIEGE